MVVWCLLFPYVLCLFSRYHRAEEVHPISATLASEHYKRFKQTHTHQHTYITHNLIYMRIQLRACSHARIFCFPTLMETFGAMIN